MNEILLPLCAGATIGVAVSGQLMLLGRVTGMTSIWRNALVLKNYASKKMDKRTEWQLAASFVAGLGTSGFVLRYYIPNSVVMGPGSFIDLLPFQTENTTTLWLRLLGSAALVGLGTTIGSGCTSGHGTASLVMLITILISPFF